MPMQTSCDALFKYRCFASLPTTLQLMSFIFYPCHSGGSFVFIMLFAFRPATAISTIIKIIRATTIISIITLVTITITITRIIDKNCSNYSTLICRAYGRIRYLQKMMFIFYNICPPTIDKWRKCIIIIRMITVVIRIIITMIIIMTVIIIMMILKTIYF